MNLTGLWTLTRKEILRFWRVPFQTLGSPVVTALLYFLVFGFAVGSRFGNIHGLSYGEFMMPGIIMMNVLTSAFFGVSSGLMLAKIMNTLSDILVSPLSYLEIVLGFTLSSVIRSFIIAVLIYLTALFFIPFEMQHPIYLFFFTLVVTAAFSLMGLIAGIWADNFEKVSFIPTFIIMPLTFLGGVFYSLEMLPPILQTISKYNPFFYIINGMRYGFYGVTDVGPASAMLVSLAILVATALIAWHLFRIGYKIKT
jgi:ABC-2 type transport system permease protein